MSLLLRVLDFAFRCTTATSVARSQCNDRPTGYVWTVHATLTIPRR
jgi:hypothetical protein